MNNDSTIKKGDVVSLQSGGPPMTVDTIYEYTSVSDERVRNCKCFWFVGDELKDGLFIFDSLKKIDSE